MTSTTTKPAATTDESTATKPGSALSTQVGRGSTSIADVVVSKIAGIAAREVDGVYDLGGQAARVVGRIRETLPGAPDLTQGVTVEVGERQAAVDVAIVAEYGVAIHDLAAGIRSNVIDAVESMTGLEVTEVNVTVHDVHFADDDDVTGESSSESRVQ
ncbi:Asp23/Gls24 family envelope stress response protein [Tsukamurella paurometabola]|uniref:Alkaline shock protein 23 n=1 Tax=Tsukamurella paurometabola TaxID=2061 RepID=A0A3P8K0V2_TSUPA|nr:Asp23/Gls24 family envelope stress response protein [Tsukamurella paurometabola]MBS4102600.1 Asp23/Gls24 family envelope stress response protein [Tsukamurella paurometabola]UEA81674.1 Asp23/Gls24 family envelope stress response protein [Tsukamurella paurometabola]VDR38684.1 Alkaline shock protein 23 [Tsukamurella paurometabola]